MPSRTGLNDYQLNALQRTLDAKARGRIINVEAGAEYEEDLEILAQVGEGLTKRFTSHFLPGGWQVSFLLLESEIRNAYAYWMNSFEAICITTSLAREIDTLCDDVAGYLVGHDHSSSGFSYLHVLNLSEKVKRASLKGLLVQGVMAFFVGHEVGHLCAGHKPVLVTGKVISEPDGMQEVEQLLFVDDFIAEAASKEHDGGAYSLRLNAHEVDADLQGIVLAAAFWLNLHEIVGSSDNDSPPELELIRAATSTVDRLLLLASAGIAIAMSLMGFKQFDGNWNKQPTHPLTAVRCVIGLRVLANRLRGEQEERLALHLPKECIEALSMVHARLGSILLQAAEFDGQYSEVTQLLKETPNEGRLNIMYSATGVGQAVALSNDVVRYLAELGEAFKSCEPQRSNAIRVDKDILVNWAASVTEP